MTTSKQDFKDKNKEFKANSAQLESTLSDARGQNDVKKLQKILVGAQNEIALTERSVKELEGRWNMLDGTDKGYYKEKLGDQKRLYENLKKQYLATKERMETQAARENINFSTAEGRNMQLKGDNREKLLQGVSDLND